MKSATEVSAASKSAKRQKNKHDVDDHTIDDEEQQADPSHLPPSISGTPWKPEDPVSFESLGTSDKAIWNRINTDIKALKSTYGQMDKKKAVEKLLIRIEQNPTMSTVHSIQHPCLLHTFVLSDVFTRTSYRFGPSTRNLSRDLKVDTLKKVISQNPSALLWPDRHYNKRLKVPKSPHTWYASRTWSPNSYGLSPSADPSGGPSFLKNLHNHLASQRSTAIPYLEPKGDGTSFLRLDLLLSYPELGAYSLSQLQRVILPDSEEFQCLTFIISRAVAQHGMSQDIIDFFGEYPQGLCMISETGSPLISIIRRMGYLFDGEVDPDYLVEALAGLIESFPSIFLFEGLPQFLKDVFHAELCQGFCRCAVDEEYEESKRVQYFKIAKHFLRLAPRQVLDGTVLTDRLLADFSDDWSISESMLEFLVTLLRVIRTFDHKADLSKVPNYARPLVPLVDQEVAIANEYIKLRRASKMMEKMANSSSSSHSSIQEDFPEALGKWASGRLVTPFKAHVRTKGIRAEIGTVFAELIRRE